MHDNDDISVYIGLLVLISLYYYYKSYNIMQHTHTQASDAASLQTWLAHSQYRWLSHDIQNEILQLAAIIMSYVDFWLMCMMRDIILYNG